MTENPFEVYRKNFGILRPEARDVIIDWCREFGDEIVIAGMKIAVKKGGVTLSYIEEILKEWASAGLKTLDEVSAYETQKAEKKRMLPGFSKHEEAMSDSVIDQLRMEDALA